ncbi:MAG TPA: DUF938 domain-containing protein [Lysobacter sp.]|nr:DUF938 domain-containing protein [Lysobacter sp.]
MIDKPFSPSCERNREPILEVLSRHFADRRRVLEIGSGTGQHAVHFAAAMPWLVWQCSDRAENLPGIRQWLAGAALPNTPEPLVLDVATGPWPLSLPPLPPPGEGWGEGARTFDAVFSANALHIMGWPEVEAFFAGIDRVLRPPREPAAPPAATLVVYGPFNYAGRYTSDSNRAFDGWLQARDPHSAIRDFEAVDALARAIGLRLVEDVAMPANNRCLVWVR